MSRSPAPLDGPTVPQRPLTPQGDRAWIDRVIGGKYAVEGILGRGGMGLVLKARHLRLDEPVAIKVLHQSLANDPSNAARMLREARAALRLSSEHIVRVMDVDTLENGVPFMVLEYLEGYDVASLAKKRQSPMPYEHVVAIMDQACRALAEAHALGIVHRDLKPANLFIVKRPDGRRVVKLLDFGVSKLDLPREAPITKQGDILGSPRYMSPEQVRAMPLDGRSDIWSVGVVLYELLTGTAPFAAPNFAVACRRVLDEAPAPLLSLRPDVPLGLAAVVDRCLEKDRERRFPDALALRDALAPFGVLSHRTGSQMTLPDIGELISSDVPAMVPVIPPPSPSVAPGAAASVDPLDPLSVPSPPSAAPPSSAPPPSGTLGTPGPVTSSAPPSGLGAVADPSSASLTSDVRLPPDATAIAARVRARRLLWIALAGLALGLAVGITMLVRGRDSSAPEDPRAATGTPQTVAKTSSASAASPPKTSATSEVVPSSTAAAGASDAAPSGAPQATASAAPEAPQEPAAKPWKKPGTTGTSTTKPPPTGGDPFGERRQ